jgi:hypothetical protein
MKDMSANESPKLPSKWRNKKQDRNPHRQFLAGILVHIYRYRIHTLAAKVTSPLFCMNTTTTMTAITPLLFLPLLIHHQAHSVAHFLTQYLISPKATKPPIRYGKYTIFGANTFDGVWACSTHSHYAFLILCQPCGHNRGLISNLSLSTVSEKFLLNNSWWTDMPIS